MKHIGARQSDAAVSISKISLSALLAETTAVQALGTMAVLIIPALAPAVAGSLGVPTSHIGYQVGLVYFTAMLASVVAGTLVGRLGPCRTSQVSMVLAATGCLVASIPHVVTVMLGSLIIGSAYGLINPAASQLLIRHSPPERRNLIFSVKQTGVPLGGIAAGLIGPSVALSLGWSAALWGVAAVCILVAAVSQRGRASLDGDGNSAVRKKFSSFDTLYTVIKIKTLWWLALSSFFFSAVQLCVVAFLVALLVQDLGFSLIGAGAVLACVQVSGAVGRITWGVVADWVHDGTAVLLGLAGMMVAASAVVMLFVVDWPSWLAVGPFIILGVSAVGWNGVYLSEVARLSPPQTVSATTGAAMFFTFSGVVFGPSVFSILHSVLNSYLRSYAFLVVISLMGAFMLLKVRRSEKNPPRS